jgi:hypothetical protein
MKSKSKQELHEEVQALIRQHRPVDEDGGMGGCVWAAFFGVAVLRRHGYQACLQAGSLSWRILNPEDDDGKPTTSTHFSYHWDPAQLPSRMGMAMGCMPEIHAWVGLVDRQELVDFSLGDLKRQVTKLGFNWRTADPPPFLWCGVRDLPEHAHYEPSRDATLYLGNVIKAKLIPDLKTNRRNL